MAIVIKELIIQGKINSSANATDEDIIKIINSKIADTPHCGIEENEKRQIIEECVLTVLKELEAKLRY